jgi:drug/metabolite transporter (DMT)-like permease
MKKAFFQLHIAIFLAGFTGVLGRLITLNEGLLVWYRMFFTTIALIFISLISKRISIPDRKGIFRLVCIGFIIALHWVFFYGSIKYSNVSVGLVCFSAIGFFSSLLEPVILKRRFDAVEVVLGLIVMLGVYLIFHFDQGYRTGILLGIISSFLAAIFTILNKEMVGKYHPETISLFELGGGWLGLSFLLPIYLYKFPVSSYLPSVADTFWLFVLSLLCTVLAFNLSIRSLQKISPFTVNLSYNLEPVYGIALAFLMYQEHRTLGSSFYLGLILIFLTVVYQSWRTWAKKTS